MSAYFAVLLAGRETSDRARITALEGYCHDIWIRREERYLSTRNGTVIIEIHGLLRICIGGGIFNTLLYLRRRFASARFASWMFLIAPSISSTCSFVLCFSLGFLFHI